MNDSFNNVMFSKNVEPDTYLFPTLSRFVIINSLFSNFPFPDTFVNYLVSGGCIFYTLYVRVFLVVIII